jgi:hypothetical protein
MQTKEDYLEFIRDLEKVIDWVANNIETENATIIITWLIKMNKKLEKNLNNLIELKDKK